MGTSARPLQCSLGTAWVGNFVQPKGPPPPGALQLVLPSPVDEGSLVLRVMPAGNVTWDWALAAFVDGHHGRALVKADAIFRRQLLPPSGLLSLPWLTRPNLFDHRLAGSGGFLGINPHTSPQELLRATAAGMCFEFARLFERVRDSGIADRIVLGGGASKGWCFRTLMAGLFAPLPVYCLDGADQETAGARGTIHAFSPRAARARTRRVPAPGRDLIGQMRRQFELYCHLCRTLRRGLPDRGGDLLIEQRKQR